MLYIIIAALAVAVIALSIGNFKSKREIHILKRNACLPPLTVPIVQTRHDVVQLKTEFEYDPMRLQQMNIAPEVFFEKEQQRALSRLSAALLRLAKIEHLKTEHPGRYDRNNKVIITLHVADMNNSLS